MENQRMNIKGFLYITIILLFFLIMLSSILLAIGIHKNIKKHNYTLIIIFAILDGMFISGVLWSFAMNQLHKYKIYNKKTIVIAFVVALFGLSPIQIIIWYMHYSNYKQANNQ